ncbi:MAG: hypothetical protein Q9186_000006 [Xanthomendoza sp. 1 TL-2023]
MSKKYILALSNSSNLQHLCCGPTVFLPNAQTYRQPYCHKVSHCNRAKPRSERRYYATAQGSPAPAHDDSPWPKMSTPTAVPTPYQIFQLHKAAPYSKRRFYQLVKLYHPDRHGHGCNIPGIDGLSPDIKMKRYRLVVAAHDILSDPARRKAYDLWGAGWNSHGDIGGAAHNRDPTIKTRWSGFHDNNSPAGNATWEDWEKWYRRDAADHQAPVYWSNGEFISYVSFVVLLMAIWQASRVNGHHKRFTEQVELIHNNASKNLHQRRSEARDLSSSDKAILRFVRAREASGIPTLSDVPHPEKPNEEDYLPP